MDDLISRQAAIDAIDNHCRNVCDSRDYPWCLDCQILEFKEAINSIPSAQPEQSRIEKELHGKTPEEQFRFLDWLMHTYGKCFASTSAGVIDWLRGEDDIPMEYFENGGK